MRSRRGWISLVALASAGCGASPSGAPSAEPSAHEQGAIAGGTLDTDDAAVFQEFTQFSQSASACTASLIAPNVLLTARHCISQGGSENIVCGRSPFGDPVAGSDTVVTNATQPSDRSTFYRGADVRVPSDGSDVCGFDVALIILASPVPASQATPLVPRIDIPVVAGEAYTAVGYGLNDDGERNPGRMQRGDLAVTCLPDQCPRLGVAPTEFLGDTGVCSGDSGGPALDTEGKVIGVVSRGSEPCATPIYGQVAAWADFITKTVLNAAETGGYAPPFWALSGSSTLDPTLAQSGQACADTSECTPGTACYYASDPSHAVCTPVCANDRQCGSGKQCVTGYDVALGGLCIAQPGTTSDTAAPASSATSTGNEDRADESCALSPGRHGSPTSGWLLVVAGLAAVLRTRSKRALSPQS
ncbi:MAG TPA: trypsin-like serine protease [Polyangiaceae bacterium]|jgi:hypothetical protein|nr:trypsin-like serine protease [Polyangiaceae bacterium]